MSNMNPDFIKPSTSASGIKLGAGESLVKKNPDGSFIVKKADGTMVKRKPVAKAEPKPSIKTDMAPVAKPSTSRVERPSTAKVEKPSTARVERPSTARVERPSTARVEKPSTARAERPSTARVERPSTARAERPSTARAERPSTARAAQAEIKVGPGETIVKKNPDGSVIVRKANGTTVKRRVAGAQNAPQSRERKTGRGRDEAERKNRNSKYVNRRPKEDSTGKKKLPIFWIGLAAWAVILLIFGIYMLSYTDKCLVKYEKSQANVAMKDFMAQFEKQVQDRTIVDHIELPEATGVLEDPSVIKNEYLAQFNGCTSITYEKDPKSYDTAAPFYNIYAHFPGETDPKGTKVARMTLKSKNSKKVFAILQLVDWSIDKIEPVLTIKTYNYSISVPNDFVIKVNGVQLTDEYLTGESSVSPEFKNVMQYVEMPSTIQYKIEGLINKPDIKIYDSTGAEVSYTPDDKGNIFVAYSAANSSAQLTDEIKDYVLKVTQNWVDFLTADLAGGTNGLETIQQYLIKDSDYWKQAKDYAVGPDITFINNHRNKDPKFTEVTVDKYVRYTDNCYSVHVRFVKNMVLTRTGEDHNETFDSTVYFVKIDDKWLIADMVATTNNNTEETN